MKITVCRMSSRASLWYSGSCSARRCSSRSNSRVVAILTSLCPGSVLDGVAAPDPPPQVVIFLVGGEELVQRRGRRLGVGEHGLDGGRVLGPNRLGEPPQVRPYPLGVEGALRAQRGASASGYRRSPTTLPGDPLDRVPVPSPRSTLGHRWKPVVLVR